MTSRSYFGKMNSTLGSVVPLAMFSNMLVFVMAISTLNLSVVFVRDVFKAFYHMLSGGNSIDSVIQILDKN